MSSNAGSTVEAEPVHMTVSIWPAHPGQPGYLVTATVGDRPAVNGHFEAPPLEELTPSVSDAGPIGATDAAADTGMRLFDALFSGELRRCWAGAVEDARSGGLRLVVESSETKIQELPWELLFDRVLVNEHLALRSGWCVLRTVPESPRPNPPRPLDQIKVQVVTVGADGGVEEQAQLVQQGLPEAQVSTQRAQSDDELERVLRARPWDVLHIAAGGVEMPDRRTYLTLGDPASTDPHAVVVLVSADELRDKLHPVHRPSLIVLTGSDTDLLALELARVVPSVVGIRGEISDKARESFLGGFYRALGRGESIEAGLVAGRGELRAIGSALAADWAAPVGYLSEPQRLVTRGDETEPARPVAPDDPASAQPSRTPGAPPAEGVPPPSGEQPAEDRLELELRMRELDLDELLTRWRQVDTELWPEAVVRRRVGLETAIADANRRLGGAR
jgi:CHAT domain